MPPPEGDEERVFINCPFDDGYLPLFRALVFTTCAAGLRPRCGLEVQDASEVRLHKILRLIDECRYGVHDLSRTELDPTHGLPRFNMPLELGLFLGCKHFGGRRHKKKSCLVLDRDRFRYQRFISDIAGQDPVEHGGTVEGLIGCYRDWLRATSGQTGMPGADWYVALYRTFTRELPAFCTRVRLNPERLPYPDFLEVVWSWLNEEDRQ